ncbi:MAG: tetraacyldisaccharide 4'-kinase [Kangiellaceae bacterium]|nr:tetraacyldisaccharide 4'-kinase [Kangiellaceae bacterium]
MNEYHAIEKLWYSRSKLTWLLWPLHLPFLILVSLKRYLYQVGFLKQTSSDKPVVVIGNLSVGGTGKTPFITTLVEMLKKNNIKVGIISRGYGSEIENYPHQVTLEDTAYAVGDEAYMQFLKLNIPVVIDSDRARARDYVFENNQLDLVISDDGLQHYGLARELEVVLFDGNRQFGNQLILPFGPLRESTLRLSSADIVVQNGLQSTNFSKYKVEINEVCFVSLLTGEEVSLDCFKDVSVDAIVGIGNPKRFFDSLKNHTQVKTYSVFKDHHAFSMNDFENFSDQNILVMTEKDAVKCKSFAKKNWYYLKIEMHFDDVFSSELLEKINEILVQ